MKSAIFLTCFVTCTLLGNLFFKRSAGEIASLGIGYDTLGILLRSGNAWFGVFFYGLAAAFWLLSLTVTPLNIAVSISACVYVLVVLLAFFFFNEAIPPARWAGMGLVFLGLIVIGSSL
ncbi:MAG: EamA family transporter [Ferrovibrio sp.]